MFLLKKMQEQRKKRIRQKLRKVGAKRLRLSVYRTNNNIYAQVIDDKQSITIASASTVDKSLKSVIKKGSNIEAAIAVGSLLANRATACGVKEVYFDRASYLYHGRIKALAESARANGLSF